MTDIISDAALAERLSRRRARVVPVLAVLFIANQALFFFKVAKFGGAGDIRTVDAVQIAAWLAWAVMLLVLLGTGGGLFRNAGVRALLNDETTRAHRSVALAAGFWAMSITAVILYFVSLYEPLGGRLALHIMLTFGVGTAMLRFGKLERAALSDA